MRGVDGLDQLVVAAFLMEGQPGPRGVTGEETRSIPNICSVVNISLTISETPSEHPAPMKILVLGAGGVGSAFAPVAARRDFFEHVVLPITTREEDRTEHHPPEDGARGSPPRSQVASDAGR
jgi:hypothetical protein